MTLIRVAVFGFLYFSKITILHKRRLEKMEDSREKFLFGRSLFRGFGKGIIDRTGAKVEVIYEDESDYKKLTSNEAVVLISNHQSNMDIPAIQGYFPIVPGFLAKKEMETWPFFGKWTPLTRSVFVDRKNPREGIKAIREAVKIVKEGYPILVFPEGTRSEDGKLGEFKNGGFKIAVDAKAKIVPITLKGTYDIQKKGCVKMYRNKKVKLIIGKVIDTNDYDKVELKNIHNIVKNKIEENFNKYQ
ncbi:MAG: 1-acyl-sn-glycerol-3-phosphate acyltransferase [Psychrilyobacter sp.]|nr:1-acyl-sn-glycerol-3-phosphate acyltransferase [Psychrilyobacter sp.]